jgi:hypothetical protein
MPAILGNLPIPCFFVKVDGMKKTLLVLNDLKKKGIIIDYAIGGGMGIVFYIEPILTYDLDVFILTGNGTDLQPLTSLYRYLKNLGYQPKQEQIVIEGIPVQFLPAFNGLLNEAVSKARRIDYQGTQARVMTVEHLLAVMLQTGRAKDRERFLKVLDEAEIDRPKLSRILKRYELLEKYRKWKKLQDEK